MLSIRIQGGYLNLTLGTLGIVNPNLAASRGIANDNSSYTAMCPCTVLVLCGNHFSTVPVPSPSRYSLVVQYHKYHKTQDISPGVRFLPPGLLQLAVLRHLWRTDNRLQLVQNAATRLVTGTRRSDHISPVLRQLHWLPVCQHVDFKVATLVHQSLSGISTPYPADDCRLAANAREQRLCSTASWTCVVTRTYSTFGDRAFGAASPGLWNSLSLHLKDADISYCEFRRSLKTFLFR